MDDFAEFMKEEIEPSGPIPMLPAGIDFSVVMDRIKVELKPYSDQIDQMVQLAQNHAVTDEDTEKAAVSMGVQAKKLKGTIESKRKEVVKNPNEFVKSVNSFCKGFTDRLGSIETGLKGKISDYQYRIELERRKAEEEARKAQMELQRQMDEEAKKAGVEAPKLPDPVIPEKSKSTRTEDGSASQRKEWTFEIEDEAKVPREYLVLDTQKVRTAVRMGVREIPGIKIYERTTTVFRG
jgi:hypothetical protein